MFVLSIRFFYGVIAFSLFLGLGFFNVALADNLYPSAQSTQLAFSDASPKNMDPKETTLRMSPDIIKSYNDYQPRIDREQPQLLRKKVLDKMASK